MRKYIVFLSLLFYRARGMSLLRRSPPTDMPPLGSLFGQVGEDTGR